MAVENLLSAHMTLIAAGEMTDRADGGVRRSKEQTVEVSAAASPGSTYDFFHLPSDAIIKRIIFRSGGLATANPPSMDVGLFHADLANGGTVDCLLAAVDVTAAVDTETKAPIAAPNQRAWEYVSSQTVDPKQDLVVRATIWGADIDLGGTMTLEIIYQ